MDTRIQHEQQVLIGKGTQIKNLLDDLEDRKTIVSGKADQIIIQKRKERIAKINEVRSAPYLGRMDVISEQGQRVAYYVGTVGIGDDLSGEEIVIDWRTDFGKLYTTYSGGKKKWPGIGELVGKRKIIIDKLKVNRVDDVGKMAGTAQQNSGQDVQQQEDISNDEFLSRVLSQTSEEHKLQEIISSLQEEQDEIIRLPMDQPIIVQGVAGSGKSSVAMHRISYLLFHYEETLSPAQILVVAPNNMFISYLQGILPELDIQGIKQDTFVSFSEKHLPIKMLKGPHESLVKRLDIGDWDQGEELTARYKGSVAFMQALQRYMEFQAESNCPSQKVHVNSDFSIPREKVEEIYRGYKHLPINRCREQVLKSIGNLVDNEERKQHNLIEVQFKNIVEQWVNVLAEGSQHRKNFYASLEQAEMVKKRKISQACKDALAEFAKVYTQKNTLTVYKEIFDISLLRGLDSSLTDDFATLLTERTSSVPSYEDLAGLLYLEHRINGIPTSYQYMIVDEAQDLSPFQLYMLKQFTVSMTILGDITQSIFSTGIESWDECSDIVFGTSKVRRMQMNTSYRSTYEIMGIANKVIENSKLPLPRIVPVNRKGGDPTIRKVTGGGDLLAKIIESLKHFEKNRFHKVAIIGKDLKQTTQIYKQLFEQGLGNLQLIDSDQLTLTENVVLIPSYLVKGMEFDAVIIPNANDQRFGMETLDAKLLYISVTRAHHDLHIYYHGTISPLLHDLSGASIQIKEDLDEIL